MDSENISASNLKYKYPKLFSLAIFFASWFVLYNIYAWFVTESTDNAYLEAEISIVSPEIDGIVSEIYVKENTMVEAGQVIAKINDQTYAALADKAKAQVEVSKHEISSIESQLALASIEQEKSKENYEFAEASFKVAESELNRVTELQKDNYASMRKLDNTEIEYERAKKEFSLAKLNLTMQAEKASLLEVQKMSALAQLVVLEQEFKLAQKSLEDTSLRAPVSGMLGNSSIRVGNFVRSGVPLFSVVPMNSLYVKANFKETQISNFTPGMQCQLTIDSAPGLKLTGTIRNISPATGAKFSLLPPSNATGNFTKIVQRVPVLIDFDIPDNMVGKLVPGMSSIVKVKVR